MSNLYRSHSRWRFTRVALAVLVCCLAASACSTSTTVQAEPTQAEPSEPTQAEPSDAVHAELSDRAFDDVLIELFGTTDTEAYVEAAERRAAELVATCMEAAGFEFQIPAQEATISPPEPTDVEAARTDGFGIVSQFRQRLSAPTGQQPDPNREYLQTLTAAEIERFFVTLDGVDPAPGAQKEDTGCNGQASDVAYADWQRFSEALPNYTALGEERDTHPEWRAARQSWSDCMTERGFDYAEPEAIRTDVYARMSSSVEEVYPNGAVPLVQQGEELVVDPAIHELLDELEQFEQAAAVANAECTVAFADEFNAVEREVQQDFVDRNRTTIDELLSAAQ